VIFPESGFSIENQLDKRWPRAVSYASVFVTQGADILVPLTSIARRNALRQHDVVMTLDSTRLDRYQDRFACGEGAIR
jgi:hypothetical protein